MIKLIVGLGNPGRQYEKTRHNAGFLFLDYLLFHAGGSWANESRFQGLLASCHFDDEKVVMLKPQTYMNKSGDAVGKVVRYYKLLPEEMLVVHDELDFAEGIVKIKKGGGHAGHNGLKDIIAHLGSKDFYRLRIGIGRPVSGREVIDYVLSKPSVEGSKRLNEAFHLVDSCMDRIIKGEIASAMNELHT